MVEKQRLEQDVNSLRLFMEDERKEMAELRRQQQVITIIMHCTNTIENFQEFNSLTYIKMNNTKDKNNLH